MVRRGRVRRRVAGWDRVRLTKIKLTRESVLVQPGYHMPLKIVPLSITCP